MPPSPVLAERRVVLFDLDGTLVDSVPDLTASVNAVLAPAGLGPVGETEVRGMVGDGAAELVRRAFARHGRETPADALASFYAHYGDHCTVRTAAYAGLSDLLDELVAAGRRLGVVTNKPTAFAETVVTACGLDRRLAAVVGPELAARRKPAPDHVLVALERLGARPDEAVMVGDGTTDVASGRDAGCATVAVLWGYRTRGELEGERPDAWAEDVPALRRLLLGRDARGPAEA